MIVFRGRRVGGVAPAMSGHPKLKEHVIGAIALMKGPISWPDFYRRLQRAFPKKHEDTPLPLPEPDEE